MRGSSSDVRASAFPPSAIPPLAKSMPRAATASDGFWRDAPGGPGHNHQGARCAVPKAGCWERDSRGKDDGSSREPGFREQVQ